MSPQQKEFREQYDTHMRTRARIPRRPREARLRKSAIKQNSDQEDELMKAYNSSLNQAG